MKIQVTLTLQKSVAIKMIEKTAKNSICSKFLSWREEVGVKLYNIFSEN